MLKTAVCGAAGRMGGELIKLITADGGFVLTGAIEREGHPDLGRDAGELWLLGNIGVVLTDKLEADADVLVDFSLPEGTEKHLGECVERKVPMVIGTTALSDGLRDRMDQAAADIPIVYAANMSPGIHVLRSLVSRASALLGDGYDVEIIEMHHNRKADAPSGTAFFLADAVSGGEKKLGRSGPGKRAPGEVGIHAVRGGTVIGEHRVIFAGEGERVELVHRAESRSLFARGALMAARFAASAPPGLYGMDAVLNADQPETF
jgi:4-hydroxy-tetrahydrodipicolinate reductase